MGVNKKDYVEQHGGQFRGKKELLKHLDGQTISARQAIIAKCYECNGYYADGKADCKMPDCPLYPYMIYREGGMRKGRQRLTEDQRKAAGERLKRGREKKNEQTGIVQRKTRQKIGSKRSLSK